MVCFSVLGSLGMWDGGVSKITKVRFSKLYEQAFLFWGVLVFLLSERKAM